ncbi:MAG: hypothetical protein ACHQ4J_05095 [Candidatus Binatia bacterium]
MASSLSFLANRRDAACTCNPDKIAAVHAYLTGHFPGCELRHFHSPTRLLQAGFPTTHGDHHVVGLLRESTLPYYVVLLSELLACSPEDISACIRRWDLPAAVRAQRIVIVSSEEVSPL